MKEPEENRLNDDFMLRSLKEQKDHNERQVESLLQHFYNEDKYTNDLRYFGDKYQQRIKEFESLKIQNQQLRYELNTLRKSIDLRLVDEDISQRVSVDRGKLEAMSRGATNISAKEDYKSQLSNISKLKEMAKASLQNENAKYDQLVSKLYKFIEQAHSTQKLINEIQPSTDWSSSQQMLLVPKKRYQQLVQIYAINMANITAKEFQLHLESKKNGNQDTINFIEDNQKRYREKYINIMHEPTFEMGVFFERLADKFGFEKEWHRYHTENTQEGVKLKRQIDEIIKKYQSSSLLRKTEEKEDQNVRQSRIQAQMREKVSELVNELAFSEEQKKSWNIIDKKIRDDELFDMSKLTQLISKQYEQKHSELVHNISSLVQDLLQECFKKLTDLFTSRLRKNNQLWEHIKKTLDDKSISTLIKEKNSAASGQHIWQLVKNLTDQKLTEVFKILEKHLVFVSANELYKKKVNKQ